MANRIKADRTVKRELARLRKFIDGAPEDTIEKRMAYTIETAIRWAREPGIREWPAPLEEAMAQAKCLRQELGRTDRDAGRLAC